MLEVLMPVRRSLRKFSASGGFGMRAEMPAIAMLARMVRPMRQSAIGMFVRYRFQYDGMFGGNTGTPCGTCTE